MSSFERIHLEPQQVARLMRRGRRMRSEAFAAALAGVVRGLRNFTDRGIVKGDATRNRSAGSAAEAGKTA